MSAVVAPKFRSSRTRSDANANTHLRMARDVRLRGEIVRRTRNHGRFFDAAVETERIDERATVLNFANGSGDDSIFGKTGSRGTVFDFEITAAKSFLLHPQEIVN